MQFYKKQPPRIFIVGNNSEIEIKDVGEIYLDANEQVTFITPEGAEYDVTRKNWGFYATPSMNARLAAQGLKAGLVMNSIGRLFLMLVEKGKENEFIDYLSNDNQRLLSWLCTDADVKQIKMYYINRIRFILGSRKK